VLGQRWELLTPPLPLAQIPTPLVYDSNGDGTYDATKKMWDMASEDVLGDPLPAGTTLGSLLLQKDDTIMVEAKISIKAAPLGVEVFCCSIS